MKNIASIVQQMTLEEKAALVTGASAWTTTPVARLGVPELFVADGPHGVRRVEDVSALGAQSIPATCFPTAALLAATWDAEVIYAMGRALGSESNAIGVGVLLGPGVNMKRTPLCGRNFEYFSEDPYLAGELATSLIEGIQSRGVGTSLKHFAANNQEHQRFSIDAVVDERTLREIYLPAFERAVKRGKPWTVMCAYNKLNGEYCSEHHALLTELLKTEWGYEGFVVSDWGAVHDRVKSLRGGLDLEMPGPKPRRTQAVVDAVRAGELDAAVLDDAVRRVLTIAFRAAETPKGTAFDVDANHALARKIAAEGMVLLKNDGILPLQNPRRVAVIGRAAKHPHFQGGGSSHINPTRVDSPFEELQMLAGNATLTYSEGYPAGDDFQQALIDDAVAAARGAEVALIFVALPSYKESEGYDRTDLDLTAQQVALIKAVSAVQSRTVVILHNSSAVVMSEWIDGVAAVLEAWMMGQAGGGAVADILYGVVNPSGKLAETFPLQLEDTPAHINFPGENGQVRYGEGLFIGYRYYDAKRAPVLFPFGYGLSYTTFAYSNAHVSATTFRDVDGVTVSVDITNTGAVAGKEIVQVYVRDCQCKLVRPEKELKGFAKVELQPGETKSVAVTLDFRAFAFWHPGHKQWVAEEGEFDILIGASAADIRASVPVTLHSTQTLPSLLNYESTVREWLEDPHGRPVFETLFQQMTAQMEHAFGGNSEEGEIGINMMGFIMGTPLTSILGFQEAMLPAPPEAIVSDLLRQVRGE
jgi:beta-glucosidase